MSDFPEWMLEEFERANERTKDLPAHARPIVTRPYAGGKRVKQPSELRADRVDSQHASDGEEHGEPAEA